MQFKIALLLAGSAVGLYGLVRYARRNTGKKLLAVTETVKTKKNECNLQESSVTTNSVAVQADLPLETPEYRASFFGPAQPEGSFFNVGEPFYIQPVPFYPLVGCQCFVPVEPLQVFDGQVGEPFLGPPPTMASNVYFGEPWYLQPVQLFPVVGYLQCVVPVEPLQAFDGRPEDGVTYSTDFPLQLQYSDYEVEEFSYRNPPPLPTNDEEWAMLFSRPPPFPSDLEDWELFFSRPPPPLPSDLSDTTASTVD